MRRFAILLTVFAAAPLAICQDRIEVRGPQLLTMKELVALSDTAAPVGKLRRKREALLRTPFVGLQNEGSTPRRPVVESLGPVLRVAAWNIQTGTEFDLIRLAFTDPGRLARVVAKLNAAAPGEDRADPKDLAGFRPQANHLMQSDVVLLNEVDLGMPRSGYRNIARDLALATGMNYAYGIEFIEVDKIHLGLEQVRAPGEEDEDPEEFAKRHAVDKSRYKGLHGTAILSRYPIVRATNVRLKNCYDWYGKEKYYINNPVEKGRRRTAAAAFLERVGREVRHGNRFALIADLAVPESPTGKVTVVAAHLENKCRPGCRREQMEELLTHLRRVRNPLILGGDLNTTGTDVAPTSITREIRKRVRNPNFWATQGIQWFSPLAFGSVMLGSVNYVKNYRDPTAASIPLIAVNRDSRLFDRVEDFRFADGGSFDFSGHPGRSANGRDGSLANSNERASKGFKPTFEFKRDYKGLLGQMRLDWLFVKPAVNARRPPFQFAPWYGRTLEHLNESTPEQMSDHHPITVDLPLRTDPVRKGVPAVSHRDARASALRENYK